MGKEQVIPPIGNFVADIPLPSQIIGDRRRSDWGSGFQDGLKEGTPEGKNRMSVRTRPLRKKDHGMPTTQRKLHLAELRRNLGRFLAADKDRPGPRSKPSEDRPGLHIALGDKDGGTKGSDGKDIDVTEMVTGNEPACGDDSRKGDSAMKQREKPTAHPLHPGNPPIHGMGTISP